MDQRLFIEALVLAIELSIKMVDRVDKLKRQKRVRIRNKIRFENNQDSGGVELIRIEVISAEKIRRAGADAGADDIGRFGSCCLQRVKGLYELA